MKSIELKRKLVFYQSFLSLIKNEDSNLGRILLQENLMAVLCLVKLLYNLTFVLV